ncbi:uncharacterized protein LOC115713430 [Cannabis sativa]|uniref:uncharacterized protein LOC115713430 n=1 Tax=Cannabis sativa TaxID=3483 RepID=UPI0029C9DF01|nr:uncharacterized protein LOC115713430 [Cannabis sativa]
MPRHYKRDCLQLKKEEQKTTAKLASVRVFVLTQADAEANPSVQRQDQGGYGEDRIRQGLAETKYSYRKGFSKISKPFTELTKKNQRFMWTDKCEASFQELKQRLITARVLALPFDKEKFVVYCYASRQGLGCVLMQADQVIAYASRQFKEYEQRYLTHDLELTARCWLELVKDYECEILYNPAKANLVANSLSKKGPRQVTIMIQISPQLAEDMVRSNIEFVVGKLHNLTMQFDMLERIKDAQLTDPELVKIREEVSVDQARVSTVSDSGMLLFKTMVYVPNSAKLRNEILEEAHTTPYSLHAGTTKMYQDLKPFFWWSGMKKNVVEFVLQCLTYRFRKSAHLLPAKITFTVDQYADLYVKEIRAMATKLKFNTTFHPQTDGQSERTIQILEDMLQACVMDFEGF